MLYESDSSIRDDDDDDDEEEEEDSNGLLSNEPSTSGRQRSGDIFTIQMTSSQSDSSAVYSPISKTPTYSHLETTEADHDEEAANGRASFISSLSLGNLHKARSFLGRQRLEKPSKSDTQFHYIRKQGRVGAGGVLDTESGRGASANRAEGSDDNVTLTSTGNGGGGGGVPKRWSYDPGGSGLLTPWSTYSELLLEFQGLSWECCVALVVRTCISEQCHAYTKFLKMAAWFTIFVLILLCFRPQVYRTAVAARDHRAVEPSGTPSLMDIIHSNYSS